MTRTARSLAFVSVVAVAAFGLWSVDAIAGGKGGGGKPERVFGGKIVTSKTRIPTSARSQSAYIAQLRKQSTDKFFEDKKKKQWKIYYIAFMSPPANDMEVTIKLYDVTSGPKRQLSAFEQYLSEKRQTTIRSYIELERQYFEPNRKLLMTVENYRGKVLAKGTFRIVGEVEKFSGQVDFSEEDTKGQTEYGND